MFRIIFFTVLGGIVGTAGSIVLRLFVKTLPPEAQLATAAFLGAVCCSIFVGGSAKAIQRESDKVSKGKRKGPLAKLTTILFWLILIVGLVTIVILGLKMCGEL